METVDIYINIEAERIAYLKKLSVNKQMYGHTARLREIERGIEELSLLTKSSK